MGRSMTRDSKDWKRSCESGAEAVSTERHFRVLSSDTVVFVAATQGSLYLD